LDTDYPIWYARFHPLRVAAEEDYTIRYSTEATQVGNTAIVGTGLKGIGGRYGKARDWYNRTNAVYLTSDPDRILAIFPRGLKPFKGKKDNIIAALNTLSSNIGDDTNVLMIAIKAEVDASYDIIHPDRSTQKSSITQTGISRSDLTDAIKAALTMQLGDLGLEIEKFKDDPDRTSKIKSFHNLEEIQKFAQKFFNPSIKSLAKMFLVKRTLVFNSKIRVKPNGGSVMVYLSTTEGGTDSTGVLVTNGQNLEFTAAAFGVTDYGTHCYITVVNQSGVKVSFILQLY
jgi:hypothetical protein